MHNIMRMRTSTPLLGAAVALAVAAVMTPALASEQASKSALVAKELTATLDAAKLDCIAASDPAKPGEFVAALYIPGAQLLVVSAKYSAPSLLVDKISKKEYRDVYMDLHSASVAGTKIFVQDQLADGLAPKPDNDQPGDAWEEGTKTLTFEGSKKAKMNDAEYDKVFADADTRYAKVLSLLLAQVKKSGT
jgi:hypothetical protein